MGIIKLKTKKNLSFTLIEMLIVVGVFGLVLPPFFNVFYSLLRQQAKVYALSQVKREGDFILNTMTNTIRNSAISIHSSTPPDEDNKIDCTGERLIVGYYFLDRYGSYFSFCKSSTGNICDNTDNYIASYSAKINPPTTPTIIPLNTNKVKISNFTLYCTQSSRFSPPIIKISFRVEYNTSSSRPEDTASLTYQTQIKMKSY